MCIFQLQLEGVESEKASVVKQFEDVTSELEKLKTSHTQTCAQHEEKMSKLEQEQEKLTAQLKLEVYATN